MKVTKKSISEWLAEHDSHCIYDSAKMKADFLKATGQEADWPEYTHRKTATIMRNRGLGGTLPKDTGVMMCYGYTVAIHLAAKHVPGFQSTKLGRGSAFWEAIDALRAANL